MGQNKKVMTIQAYILSNVRVNNRLRSVLYLTPLSAIFQLYHGDHFQWWKKREYPERTTDHGQETGLRSVLCAE